MKFLLHPASVSGNGRCQVLCKTALSDIAVMCGGVTRTTTRHGLSPLRFRRLAHASRRSVLNPTRTNFVTNSEHARQVSDRQLLPPVISSVLSPPILPRGSHVFIAPIFTKDRVPRSSNLLLHLRSVGMRPQVRITKPARRSVDSEAPGLPDVRPSRCLARNSQEGEWLIWLDEIAACFTPGRPPSGLESLRNRKICNA